MDRTSSAHFSSVVISSSCVKNVVRHFPWNNLPLPPSSVTTSPSRSTIGGDVCFSCCCCCCCWRRSYLGGLLRVPELIKQAPEPGMMASPSAPCCCGSANQAPPAEAKFETQGLPRYRHAMAASLVTPPCSETTPAHTRSARVSRGVTQSCVRQRITGCKSWCSRTGRAPPPPPPPSGAVTFMGTSAAASTSDNPNASYPLPASAAAVDKRARQALLLNTICPVITPPEAA
mmetsp:Transcript_25321/g.42428  ORF Transcript_25321/g.42428 Transcript_25321/m.42428 type:complete len:231 (+) Transcript_25321:1462-2154(+)